MNEKTKSLQISETLHKDIKGLSCISGRKIKYIVQDAFRSEFKTDLFFNFCKVMHGKYIDERRSFGQNPLDFDGYCATHLEWLKDEFHKSL